MTGLPPAIEWASSPMPSAPQSCGLFWYASCLCLIPDIFHCRHATQVCRSEGSPIRRGNSNQGLSSMHARINHTYSVQVLHTHMRRRLQTSSSSFSPCCLPSCQQSMSRRQRGILAYSPTTSFSFSCGRLFARLTVSMLLSKR